MFITHLLSALALNGRYMEMRSEKEMFGMILGFAEKDERIRAVSMEGSRVNKNVPKDMFQDYDISYHVTDMDSFISDKNWIDVFGNRIIMQMPEAMSLYPPQLGNWFSYLMLFEDWNRIDMKLVPVGETALYLRSDKLIKILLDKDGIFPVNISPSDEDYHVKKPSREFFDDCCNEFWWVCTYVAKGLWRKEILYANQHLNDYVRPALLQMLEWRAGILTDFSVSVGKSYKYLERYLSVEEWDKLLKTYRCDSYEAGWSALLMTVELFRDVSLFVARELGYKYNEEDDRRVALYLNRVRNLS